MTPLQQRMITALTKSAEFINNRLQVNITPADRELRDEIYDILNTNLSSPELEVHQDTVLEKLNKTLQQTNTQLDYLNKTIQRR